MTDRFMNHIGKTLINNGHRTAILAVLCFFVVCAVLAATPRKRTKKQVVDDRVYLIHSDVLKYDMFGINPEAQIAKGHVQFRHKGATLWCDSAYYYQSSNSFRAFGHVRFKQGDTLSMTCDNAWYDGQAQMMEARHNVVLHHRKQTLYTDSLNYDRLYDNAYFFKGGRLIDGQSKLSSDWGEYNTSTKRAVFYYDVQLVTPKNRVSTDTLYYNTVTSMAHVVGLYTADKGSGKTGPSLITNKDGVVTTQDAYFNTKKDLAELYGRSTIVNQEKTITGDTLYYDSATGYDKGYGNVVFVDSKNKSKLLAGELQYNEKTGAGFATKRALAIDFSQKDTLYMHADTMRIETFNINTDSVYRKLHCYPHMRAYRVDFQAVSDSVVYSSLDSCMTMYRDPIVWSDGRQLTGEVIKVFTNDSTVREAHVLEQALSIELMSDSTHYNQISSRDIYAYFENGAVRKTDAVSSVRAIFYPTDSGDSTLIGLNYVESDTMRMFVSAERKLERIWMPKAEGTLYPMTQIPPGKEKLNVFTWFDYVRPLGPDDLFEWRPKAAGTELRKITRHAAPLQKLTARETPAEAKPDDKKENSPQQ